MEPADDPCAQPTTADIVTGSLLLVGVCAAYLPQVVEIVLQKSSDGVSGFFVVLALLSASCTAVNAIITFWPGLMCCKTADLGLCIAIQLPLLQLVLPLLFSFVVLGTYAHFSVPNRNRGCAALGASMLFTLAAFCAPLFMLLAHDGTRAQAVVYATVAGLAGGVLAMVTFLPQIATTYKLKRKGSLSVPALVVMFVGNWIVAAYLLLNAGGFSLVSIALVSQNFVTAIEIGVLLAMLVVFALRRRRLRSLGINDESPSREKNTFIEVTTDATPLLK
jgi:uncharacterized protein with PQ loop repeat